MIYQKLLVGADPYFVSVGGENSFALHRHPEIELSCCLDGTYPIWLEDREHLLQPGEVALVNPNVAHAVGGGNCTRLTVEVGHALLGSQFEQLVTLNSGNSILQLKDSAGRELWELIAQTARFYRQRPVGGNLLIKGNVYKISALLLQLLLEQEKGRIEPDSASTGKIEYALDIIYNRYYEPLPVEQVSAICGYSKSSFCRVFKAVTGDTFHNTLNRHRIEIAQDLLLSTDHTVEKIAEQIGFPDAKSFCRVFKKLTGISAGTYRKIRKQIRQPS